MKTALQKLNESSTALTAKVTDAIRGKDLATGNLGKALIDFATQTQAVIAQLQEDIQALKNPPKSK